MQALHLIGLSLVLYVAGAAEVCLSRPRQLDAEGAARPGHLCQPEPDRRHPPPHRRLAARQGGARGQGGRVERGGEGGVITTIGCLLGVPLS